MNIWHGEEDDKQGKHYTNLLEKVSARICKGGLASRGKGN